MLKQSEWNKFILWLKGREIKWANERDITYGEPYPMGMWLAYDSVLEKIKELKGIKGEIEND